MSETLARPVAPAPTPTAGPPSAAAPRIPASRIAPAPVAPAPAAARPVAPAPVAARPRREPAIDLVRNASLVVVLILHALMFGVTVTPDGPAFANALEHEAWFPPVTWLVQVMPLFFIAGGFASISAWRAIRARGGTAAEYVRARLERLLVPTLVLATTVGVLLAVALGAGLPPELVAEASFRVSQPLWFLAVYVAATSLVPLLTAAHERAPRLTLAGLLAGAVLVDALRGVTGVEAIGAINYAFVWLALQQLGFWYRDGALRRRSRGDVAWIAAAAVGGLAVLTSTFGYPVDMLLDGNNPATVALFVLGVGQLAVLRLVHPALIRLSRRPRLAAASTWLTPRAMTLYLWHMPVLVTLTGLSLASGLWMPEPGTPGWWLTRPVFLVVAALACLPVVAAFRRFERGLPAAPPLRGRPANVRATAAVLAGVAGVVVLLAVGFAPLAGAAVATGLCLSALGTLRMNPGSLRRVVVLSGHVANRRGRTRSA